MNTYRRPSQEQYAYSSDPASIAACYETPTSPELSYHSSSSYNMMHPFSSYPSAMSSYYGPQTPMGDLPGTVMHPALGALPTTRHEQQSSFRDPRYMNSPRYMHAPHFMSMGDSVDYGIENQESFNEDSMLSEPVCPPLDGFPNVEEFDDLMKSYVNDLSIKKQDKALINAKRAHNIRIVLDNPKDTGIESAQFRFWVKKMFQLDYRTSDVRMALWLWKLICHEGKPVAIREKLFKILTRAHQQCQHGGRDKTSTHIPEEARHTSSSPDSSLTCTAVPPVATAVVVVVVVAVIDANQQPTPTQIIITTLITMYPGRRLIVTTTIPII
ncbi:hypothetical protein PISL3812_00588 [Talaromyces islandicus]|uniref:Uncharacterized protein n=1 Tax=Talaromyces islandicus TaxID=28573 RepID=A0A0U1LJP1_TALIS|nr:hypothetical protein PISL3812_00588 [Talaromyces islandicus]